MTGTKIVRARVLVVVLLALGLGGARAFADDGGCCLPGGTCVNAGAFECAGMNGHFLGKGVACSDAACLGACCLLTGCELRTEVSCDASAGVFQGLGTTCTTTTCDGACCLPGVLCQEIAEPICTASNGVFIGNGVSCVDAQCLGACCTPDGLCGPASAGLCAASGGTFAGNGTACADVACGGGCCLDGGGCIETGEIICLGMGTYQGDGIACADVVCPADATGACCVGGSCSEQTALACAGAGGVYQGDGIPCAGLDCPAPPNGACCLVGGCDDGLDAAACAAAGGTFRGAGLACVDVLCPGACCPPTGACLELPAADCAALVGVYQGDGTTCAAIECDGACCFAIAPTCEVTTEFECLTVLGVFRGPGTVCADAMCDGGCCLPGGVCEQRTELECIGAGGAFRGNGSDCAVACAGACCAPDGTCTETTATDCLVGGGFYQGDGTACGASACATGACCLDGGACVEVLELVCLGAGRPFTADLSCADGFVCPLAPGLDGWTAVDNGITLTMNEPSYWAVSTGQPKGVSPFTVVDADGRPADDGTTDRVLRGFIVAWAVDAQGRQIRWNHLEGEATVVHYAQDYAWEYNAYTYAVNPNAAAHGALVGTPGDIRMNGDEYAVNFDELVLNFQASGATAWGTAPGVVPARAVTVETDLALLPMGQDFRQTTFGPVVTKASILIWNENETKFSGTHRCVTCWDSTLLGLYADPPNSFLRMFLQTDHGKARIDGVAEPTLCDVFDDPGTPADERVTSIDAPLLGVHARLLAIDAAAPDYTAAAAGHLVGTGEDATARILYDVPGDPGEATWPGTPAEKLAWMTRAFGLEAGADPLRAADPGASTDILQHAAAGAPTAQRVDASTKGSLLVFPKVELRWNEAGDFVQDTFISLTNDYPQDVHVQMYFVLGDPPE